jgi:hypothetical protein
MVVVPRTGNTPTIAPIVMLRAIFCGVIPCVSNLTIGSSSRVRKYLPMCIRKPPAQELRTSIALSG